METRAWGFNRRSAPRQDPDQKSGKETEKGWPARGSHRGREGIGKDIQRIVAAGWEGGLKAMVLGELKDKVSEVSPSTGEKKRDERQMGLP